MGPNPIYWCRTRGKGPRTQSHGGTPWERARDCRDAAADRDATIGKGEGRVYPAFQNVHGPATVMPDSGLQNCQTIVVLSQPLCGTLSWQTQETFSILEQLRFTEKLERYCREFPRTLYPVFPLINSLH